MKQYFQLINNLDHEMNASAFDAITTTNCPCRSFAQVVRDKARNHEYFFGQIRLTSTAPVVDSAHRVQVLVTYDSSSGGTATDGGHVLYHGKPHRGTTENFVVERVNGGWLISLIQEIRKGKAR